MNVRVAAPAIGRPALPRLAPRTLLAIPLVLAALVGGWLWLRDSSLVAVDHVVVIGGTRTPAARSALDAAAREMTTLHYDEQALRASVARFSIVRGVSVQRDLPHTLRITVDERRPVGVIVAGDARVVVADDGVLLRDTPAGSLPVIPARVPPGGARVADSRTRARVALLAAAPRALRARILRVLVTPDGLVVRLDGGQELRFGGRDRLEAKWIAVRRVLADPAARSAKYLDVRVPERPAAGGLSALDGGAQVQAPASAATASATTPATTPQQAAPQPQATTPQQTVPQQTAPQTATPQTAAPVQPATGTAAPGTTP